MVLNKRPATSLQKGNIDPVMSMMDMTQNHLIVRLQTRNFEECWAQIIAFISRFNVNRRGSTY